MSRIKKRGLDYFPISTDFIHDRIVRRIMKSEGDAAVTVLVETLCSIYTNEGYYALADALFYEDLADNLYEKDAAYVQRVITLASEYGLFDSTLFREYGLLTSADIQRQFLFATKRRNISLIDERYCLLSPEEQTPAISSGKGKEHEEDTSKSPKANQETVPGENPQINSGKDREINPAVNSEKGSERNPETVLNTPEEKELYEGENAAIIPVNATFFPENSQNVYFGTHSIAQNSIAEHSVAKNRKDSPSPSSPEAECGNTESGNPKGEEEKEKKERGGKEGGKEENFLEKNTEAPLPSKRREWTNETLSELQPPTDGIGRNYDGLLYNMRLYGIPPMEQYAIIRKSNFGAIGGPVWKGFCALRDSCGKIKMPGRYLLSVMNR